MIDHDVIVIAGVDAENFRENDRGEPLVREGPVRFFGKRQASLHFSDFPGCARIPGALALQRGKLAAHGADAAGICHRLVAARPCLAAGRALEIVFPELGKGKNRRLDTLVLDAGKAPGIFQTRNGGGRLWQGFGERLVVFLQGGGFDRLEGLGGFHHRLDQRGRADPVAGRGLFQALCQQHQRLLHLRHQLRSRQLRDLFRLCGDGFRNVYAIEMRTE